MATISITIEESIIQKIAGIPLTISLSTNVPATIFYTLDGTTPTTSSLVSTGPITLPTNNPSVTLKTFATDGTDTSIIITQLYGPDNTGVRLPHGKVTNLNSGSPIIDLFPFGGTILDGPPHFDGIAGITMDTPPYGDGIPDGYDGTNTGTRASETDKPLDSYKLVYSETDALGKTGKGVGTLPSHTTILVPPSVSLSSSSDTNSGMFNAKALVIFQDSTKEQYDPSQVNVMRPYFSLQDSKLEKIRDGALLFATALEGTPITGSFLKSYYNHKDNTITYYYYDNSEGRWIISKAPFQPKQNSGGMYNMVFPRGEGSRFVFKWLPFQRRVLF